MCCYVPTVAGTDLSPKLHPLMRRVLAWRRLEKATYRAMKDEGQ
jgi:hypothetical protein